MVSDKKYSFSRRSFLKNLAAGALAYSIPVLGQSQVIPPLENRVENAEKREFKFAPSYGFQERIILPNESGLEKPIYVYMPAEKQIYRIADRVKVNKSVSPNKANIGKLKEDKKGIVDIIDREGNRILKVQGEASHYDRSEKWVETAVSEAYFDDEFSFAASEALGLKIPFIGRIQREDEKGIYVVYAVANNFGPYSMNLRGNAKYRYVNGKKVYIPHEKRIADLTLFTAELTGIFGGIGEITLEYIADFDKNKPKILDIKDVDSKGELV